MRRTRRLRLLVALPVSMVLVGVFLVLPTAPAQAVVCSQLCGGNSGGGSGSGSGSSSDSGSGAGAGSGAGSAGGTGSSDAEFLHFGTAPGTPFNLVLPAPTTPPLTGCNGVTLRRGVRLLVTHVSGEIDLAQDGSSAQSLMVLVTAQKTYTTQPSLGDGALAFLPAAFMGTNRSAFAFLGPVGVYLVNQRVDFTLTGRVAVCTLLVGISQAGNGVATYTLTGTME